MTMRRGGISKPWFFIAVRTRSLLSLTEVSGNPTISQDGMPRLESISTSMASAARPLRAAEWICASMDHSSSDGVMR